MNRYFAIPLFRSDIPLTHAYAILLGRIDAPRANELLGALSALETVAASFPQLSSMRFTETVRSISLAICPWRSTLHDTFARHSDGKTYLWLPPGFTPVSIRSQWLEPTTMTTVFFRVAATGEKLLLFEVTDLSDKYHTTELPIDLLEVAAGVRLMPAFPSPPVRTKDS